MTPEDIVFAVVTFLWMGTVPYIAHLRGKAREADAWRVLCGMAHTEAGAWRERYERCCGPLPTPEELGEGGL